VLALGDVLSDRDEVVGGELPLLVAHVGRVRFSDGHARML
jgi:hypothetical protein